MKKIKLKDKLHMLNTQITSKIILMLILVQMLWLQSFFAMAWEGNVGILISVPSDSFHLGQ